MTVAVLVSGIGGGGARVWPAQDATLADAGYERVYVDLTEITGGAEAAADAILAVEGDLCIVAHSYGGNAALIAAALAPERVRAMVLCEPSLNALTGGQPGTEQYRAAVAPVFDAHRDDAAMSDEEFSRAFWAALGQGEGMDAQTHSDIGRNYRDGGPSWLYSLDPSVCARMPTLVLTGGWNAMYEETAAALVVAGARHEVLEGYGHHPHEHPDANALILSYLASAE